MQWAPLPSHLLGKSPSDHQTGKKKERPNPPMDKNESHCEQVTAKMHQLTYLLYVKGPIMLRAATCFSRLKKSSQALPGYEQRKLTRVQAAGWPFTARTGTVASTHLAGVHWVEDPEAPGTRSVLHPCLGSRMTSALAKATFKTVLPKQTPSLLWFLCSPPAPPAGLCGQLWDWLEFQEMKI